MNELELYLESDRRAIKGFRTVLVTESGHPFIKHWWPPGHIIGYEHTFTHTVYDLLEAMADGVVPEPNFEDGARNQRVMEAIERSAKSRKWVGVQT
jgi:predicted dehydrogenase